MTIKFIFILIIILSYIFFRHQTNGIKNYFLLAILFSVIREINVPMLGDVVPAVLMFWLIFIDLLFSNKISLRSWGAYIIYLLLSIMYGLIHYDFIRVLNWANPILVVMVISCITPIIITKYEDLQKFIKYILFTCSIFSFSAIISYWGFYDGVVLFHIDHDGFAGISRIYGISYSNLVQTIAVISICLLPTVRLRKIIKYVLILGFAYAAIITLKRMSLIALGASLTYYIYYTYREGDKKSMWIGVLMIIIALQFHVMDSVINRFDIFASDSEAIIDHSALSRVHRLNIAYDEFLKNPIIGGGAGAVIYVHNGIMEILANCGLIGIFTIFIRYLYPIKGLLSFNPWSAMTLIFVITCLSLEATMSRLEIMIFLGLFIGGYSVSSKLGLNYKPTNS